MERKLGVRQIAVALCIAVVVSGMPAIKSVMMAEVFKQAGIRYYPISPVASAGYFDTFAQRIREYIDGYLLEGDFNLYEYRFFPLSSRPPLPALFFSFFSHGRMLEWG